MNYNDLVTVYEAADSVTAAIIKNALNAEGIRCFLEGENQAGEAGLIAFGIKLQVPASDADRASKFIERHEHKAGV